MTSLASPAEVEGAIVRPATWRADLRVGLCCWFASTVITAGAVWFGARRLPSGDGEPPGRRSLVEAMLGFDGPAYKQIAQFGYSYRPRQMSNVVFFPVYPLAALDLAFLTGLPIEVALVAMSNVCFAAALVLLAAYCRLRAPASPERLRWFVVLAGAFFPTGCFFHMAYSESCFLLLSLAAMYALERQSRHSLRDRAPVRVAKGDNRVRRAFAYGHLGVVAGVVGLATATRPTGVALLAPLAMYLWQARPSLRSRLRALALGLPLGSWGLLAYMGYQQAAFGNPLAFAHEQQSWRLRPSVPHAEKWLALATLEPLRAVYDSASRACWRRFDRHWGLSFQFFNPIFFVAAWLLVAWGVRRRWLSAGEAWLSAVLLLIPYVTRAYEMGMGSTGRFVSVAFPVYLVVGHLLLWAPRWLVAVAFAAMAFYHAAFCALFAARHYVF